MDLKRLLKVSGRAAPLATWSLVLGGLVLTIDLVRPGPATSMAAGTGSATNSDPYSMLPATLSLTAVIRDFKAKGDKGGHADFESYANSYITTGLVENSLDSEGKPVFKTKRGQQITKDYKDSTGRIINPAHYDKSRGDVAGTMSAVTTDQLTSAAAFSQWYRDGGGVSLSKAVPLSFTRVAGTNRYVFNSATDEPYKSRGGFFPIDGDLYGNYGSTGHNFSFTTEIDTKFVYDKSKNQVFTFTGDDDVWVFIDGKLVLDLGGLHPKKEQSLELNRLGWLADGKSYSLKVFHAERHTDQSNFRIETTLQLVPAELPATSGLYD